MFWSVNEKKLFSICFWSKRGLKCKKKKIVKVINNTYILIVQLISDNLSAIFLTATDAANMEEACARAYGLAAKKHLNLVMSKLETLHKNQVKKKSSSFFGMFNRQIKKLYLNYIYIGCLVLTPLNVFRKGWKHILNLCIVKKSWIWKTQLIYIFKTTF